MGCVASAPLPSLDVDAPLGKGQAGWVSPAKPGPATSRISIMAAMPFAAAAVAPPVAPAPAPPSILPSPFAGAAGALPPPSILPSPFAAVASPTAAAGPPGPAAAGAATGTPVLASPFAAVALPKADDADAPDPATAPAPPPSQPLTPPSPPDPHARRARDVYTFGRVLGSGGFSVVRSAVRKADGARFAAKVLPLPPEEADEEEEEEGEHAARRPTHLARPAPSLLLPSAASTGGEPGGDDPLAAAAAAAAAAADPPAGSTRAEALREVALQARLGLGHPHLLGLVDWFVAPDHAVLVTELAPGGALLDALLARSVDGACSGFDEAGARAVAAGLLSAVAALHAAGIAHRDIKLDNILLARPGDLASVKLGDFGLATSLLEREGGGAAPAPRRERARPAACGAAGTAPPPHPPPPPPAPTHHALSTSLNTLCGTPEYVAPEVLGGRGYGQAADCWSVGVCLFILLSGYAPFSGADEKAVLRAVRSAKGPDFDDPAWEAVSGGARGLVARLLDPNPATRLTAADALRHPWVAGVVAKQGAAAPNTKRASSSSGRPPLPATAAWRPAALAAVAQRRLATLAAARVAAVAAAVAQGEGAETTLLATRASAPLGDGVDGGGGARLGDRAATVGGW